mmetsp:Transcript_10668/g.39839  ORF Transcript_10668/g.39839 Transcript_10668/m.39839 type:complete len:103 (-) Transcript_10668:2725-3033(-)
MAKSTTIGQNLHPVHVKHPTLKELRALPNTHDSINMELEIDKIKNPLMNFLIKKRWHWGLYSGDYLLVGWERYVYNGILIAILLTFVLGSLRILLFLWNLLR